MGHIERLGKPIYPYQDWVLTEEQFDPANNLRSETLFAQGNGYFGMRGNFEEGYAGPANTSVEGNYLNAFFESETIHYPEVAYGYAEHSQTMLNVTNGKIIRFFFEDEEFKMLPETIADYKRTFDLRTGILQRQLIWRSRSGKRFRIEISRLVSFSNKHIAAIRFAITPLDGGGKIRLVSALDGDVRNLAASNDPRVGSGLHGRVLDVKARQAEDEFGLLVQQTRNSQMTLACAMNNRLRTTNAVRVTCSADDAYVRTEYDIDAVVGQPIVLDKFIAYLTARDVAEDDLADKVKSILAESMSAGFEALAQQQSEFLTEFWSKADVEINGDPAIQQGLRVNLFHLLQSVGRDGLTGIGAKGLTGEGYEGHYFWDTETYIFPFFLYSQPEISRKLLEVRYRMLDKARERARQMSHPKGALFPWRTIDGEECSAYYPAGTAQYHINADIAFAVQKYVEATQDAEFRLAHGAEILFETARLWADLGEFIPAKGNAFCFNCVTGPDEYNAVVDNNYYTNLMAKANLEYAYDTARWMESVAPTEYQHLCEKIQLTAAEIDFWKTAADRVYLPTDPERGIFPQDDEFLNKAPWDFKNVPADQYPLLLHFHPLVIYRHQVCKQADVVLALFLLGHLFTLEEKKKNFDFYEPLTTHDSSLSTAVFSIMAAELGYHDKAYRYFLSTARMDLDDCHGNTKDGIHAANMAGTWMCVVNGFAGMRVHGDTLSFKPYLPAQWTNYTFKVTYQGRLIEVAVHTAGTTYRLLNGEPITILHNGEPRPLAAN
ncbi:MAG: glycosyl hydrolase family 65 protein [Anaerolineae bacterium]